MLLAVDIGNSQISLGVFVGERPIGCWRHKTDVAHTVDQYGVFLSGVLRSADIEPRMLEGVIIASVVPNMTKIFCMLCEKYLRIKPLVVDRYIKGVPMLAVDNPDEVGADIIANVTGGLAVYGAPLIIVDFGTATSFDCISAGGAYLGGAFIPGIETSMHALLQNAALLSATDMYAPMGFIGHNSADCLRSGFVYGFSSQADGILQKLKSELGTVVKVVATGGLADNISAYCKEIDLVDENITLIGLSVLYEKNK